jgi:hypothetical protein
VSGSASGNGDVDGAGAFEASAGLRWVSCAHALVSAQTTSAIGSARFTRSL